jgi:hypothetical protein
MITSHASSVGDARAYMAGSAKQRNFAGTIG